MARLVQEDERVTLAQTCVEGLRLRDFNKRSIAGARDRLTTSFEILRFKAFDGWYRLLSGDCISYKGVAVRGYPMNRFFAGPVICGPDACELGSKSDLATITSAEKPGYRVLFIGTSQTIGEARRSSKRLSFRASITC